MQDHLSTLNSTLAQVQAQFAPDAPPPFLSAPLPALSQRCLKRAGKLRALLPRTLPSLHLGTLKSDLQGAYSLTTPFCALSPIERQRLSAFDYHDLSTAFVSITCTPESLAPNQAALTAPGSHAVVFELMPVGESLVPVEVRPTTSLDYYDFLALLWACNLSFLEQQSAQTLLNRPQLSAPLGSFLSSHISAWGDKVTAHDLVTLGALYVHANARRPQARFDLSALLLHSPWRHALNASLERPGPAVAPERAELLADTLLACHHYLSHQQESWLIGINANAPLSTLALAQMTELSHELKSKDLVTCLGAKPRLVTPFLLYLASNYLAYWSAHRNESGRSEDEFALALAVVQVWAHYLATCTEESDSLERLTTLSSLSLMCLEHDELVTPLGIAAIYAILVSLLHPEQDSAFGWLCPQLHEELASTSTSWSSLLRASLQRLAPELSLSPERCAIALSAGLTPLLLSCRSHAPRQPLDSIAPIDQLVPVDPIEQLTPVDPLDQREPSDPLDQLEQLLAAQLQHQDSVSTAQQAALKLQRSQGGASLLQGYLGLPQDLRRKRFNSLLTQHPKLLVSGLKSLSPDEQDQVLSALPLKDAAPICEFLSYKLPQDLRTKLGAQLSTAQESLARAVLTELSTRAASSASQQANRAVRALTPLCAQLLVQPEHHALWDQARENLTLLISRDPEALAQAVSASLQAHTDALAAYLQTAAPDELGTVLHVLAQGLRLVALERSKVSAALTVRPEYLEQWLDLVDQVGSTHVAPALAGSAHSWSAGLFYHARHSGLRRRCWELLPASALKQVSLNQLEPLLSELDAATLPQHQLKLRAVLDAVLTTNLSDYTASELAQVHKLLALNLRLNPALYAELLQPSSEVARTEPTFTEQTSAELSDTEQASTERTSAEPDRAERLGLIITNLMILGRRVSAVSDAVVAALKALPLDLVPVLHTAQDRPTLGGTPNVLGSLLEGLVGFSLTHNATPELPELKLLSPKYAARCLLRHSTEFDRLVAQLSQMSPASRSQLTALMALLVIKHPNNAQVLTWLAAWLQEDSTRAALTAALVTQLSPQSHESEHLESESLKSESLKSERPEPQLLALDVTSPDSLKLLGLLPRSLRLQHAKLFLDTPLWTDFIASELQDIMLLLASELSPAYLTGALALLGLVASDQEQQALALCCALSDSTVRAERPALSTALLTDAPNQLLTAVSTFSAPDYAPLRELLPAKLYRRIAPEQPWLNETNLSLAHQLGCTLSHIPDTLSSYLIVGPGAPALAALTPLLPWTKCPPAPHPADNKALSALVRSRLKAQSLPGAPKGANHDLSDADFTTPGKYLLYGALSAIKKTAPALTELLKLSLKGAPSIVALSALPKLVKATLLADANAALVLGPEELNAAAALVVSAQDLADASYPVARWCSSADLAQLTTEALSAYSLLLVGVSSEVLASSLEPQELATGLNLLFYHQQGREDLALALEQYSEQLNVLSASTSQALLELHRAQASSAPRVIATHQLDGTLSLYTLGPSSLAQVLAAAPSCTTLKLTLPELTVSVISTNEPPSLGASAPVLLEEGTSALARDLEQSSSDPGLLAARCSYSARVRARYFATQVALLEQVAAQSSSPVAYLIEYERDVVPLNAYLKAQYPQLAARTTVLSLSSLLPQALSSDLVDQDAAPKVLATLRALPGGTMLVINGLEVAAHQDLAEVSQGAGVHPSLMTLGQGVVGPDVTVSGEQGLTLLLLQGLMVQLAAILGPKLTAYSYYLLEPSLNEGLSLSEPEQASLLQSLRLAPLYLKPFPDRTAKIAAQDQAQAFFSAHAADTTAALQSLDAWASHLSARNSAANEPGAHEPAANEPGTHETAVNEPAASIYAASERPQDVVAALRPESPLLLNKQQGAQALELLSGEGEASKLELTKALRAIAYMFIGGHEWRSYQRSALPALLKREHDALISLPTGGGKSVLFQGPAWYRSFYSGRLSVVITPLRALMVDQVLALRDKNYLSVDYLSADRPGYEIRQVTERIRSGVTTLLYITPERLRSRYFVQLLKERYEQDGNQGEYFIFDEAHCISQWGKEFRPDYIYAAKLIAQLRASYDFSVVMCSATMTTQVIDDLTQYLRPGHLLLGEIGTNYNPIRPHIGLTTQQVPSDLHARVAAIITFIRSHKIDFTQSRMLVFCQLRHSTEALCVALENYAAHLTYMYRYQQRHPGFKFEALPLTDVLRQIGDQPAYFSALEAGADEEQRRATLSALEQAAQQDEASTDLGAAVEVQDNEHYGQAPATDALFVQAEQLDEILTERAFSYRDEAQHELCCDLEVIPADDPLLQLSHHIGFFHAQMSARAREHVFTRYKESDLQVIAQQVKKRSALWFNDALASSERGGSPLEHSMLGSNEPLYLLCATKAFGMGMDLPNIHYVLHAQPSGVFEDYLQEVGRAGRSQSQYEAAFPQNERGERPLLPATCLYDQEDFDKAMERLNKSLISWDQLMLADELVRTYVGRFGPLSEAIAEPVVVPSDLFARDVEHVLDPGDPENQSNQALGRNSTLLFYHLEDLGRIKLGFRAPCPLQLTLNRTSFHQLWAQVERNPSAVLNFAPNDELGARVSERDSARDQLAQRCVLIVLKAQLENFDAAYQGAAPAIKRDNDGPQADTSPDAPTDVPATPQAAASAALPEQVALVFDLQYFLQQCNHNTPLKQRLTLTSTINALIELMAAGALSLQLPFSLSFNLGQGVDYYRRFNQAEVQYYVSRAENYVPPLTAPVLPHLNLTLRVVTLILERSYQHYCAQLKQRRESGQLEQFDDGLQHGQRDPLPDYPGLAFDNHWLNTTVREFLEPYAQEFEDTLGLSGNPAVPWISPHAKRKNDLNSYLERHLLPDIKLGVSALLQLMPYVKLTRLGAESAADSTNSNAATARSAGANAPARSAGASSAGASGAGANALVVKTWSNAFYLMLDLIYEDSWRLLTELNRTQGLNPVTTTAVTFASLAAPESAPEQETQVTPHSYLNNWAEIVFALGLRHESSAALLERYELSLARSHVVEHFAALKHELNTYHYFNQLLAFLQAVGLIRHSALLSHGYELTLTPECITQPLDQASGIESAFFQRRKQFEALAQFKRARLALMQVYCQEVPDDKRRLFIEEFFKSKDYSDYIKHIGNFSDANSSILSEITASNLALAEEQLRANPEQWAVYQSPADLSINVMAGPGSGKTHLLALRCVRLIYQEHVAPESVLILAYNRAVVVELKTRLDRLFTNLGLRKIGRKLAIFTFHSLAKVCLGNELNAIDPQEWECTLIARLKAQPQLFIKRFAALRYIMIDEFQDITHARLELLHLLKQCYRTPLYLFTIGDINQSIYGFNRVANMRQDQGVGSISAAQYAACLGPEPYYRDLQRLFEPTTMSLKLNYRSFPNILERADKFALDRHYTSQSAPLLERYAPHDVGYCALFDVTAAAAYRAQQGQHKLRHWEQDLGNILRFVHRRNEQAQVLAQEAAAQLGLQDSEASARYEQLIFAAASLSANAQRAQSATAQGANAPSADNQHAQSASPKPPQVPRAHSGDELLLESKYRRVESIALFFRTNNEVYRALEQVRALPPELLADVEIRLQSSSSIALWREREFYAIYHFIKQQGTKELNFTNQGSLTLAPLAGLSHDELYAALAQEQDAATELKLLTQSLMERYLNWDQHKLDQAYCLALSFGSTMMSGLTYTWADLGEYYTDLLARDDGGQCYKLYESMARSHLIAQKRINLTLSTMHKVKGLEYDMVLLPPSHAKLPLMSHDYVRPERGEQKFERQRYYSWEQACQAASQLPLGQDEQADLAEERRLYYVAYTRARKFLYVYYGERERALDLGTRYLSPDNQVLWSENDDSVDNYVISFNATSARQGANDYIAHMVKPHDAVLIVAQGDQCYIQHQVQNPYGPPAPWFTIGRLSQKSKIRNQMLTHHVSFLSGLFISNIVVWTYEDTVKSDLKRLQDALSAHQISQGAQQGLLNDLKLEDLDLNDPKVRAELAARLNIILYAPYWAHETQTRGYCYLVTLAGRGTPH